MLQSFELIERAELGTYPPGWRGCMRCGLAMRISIPLRPLCDVCDEEKTFPEANSSRCPVCREPVVTPRRCCSPRCRIAGHRVTKAR